MQRSFLRSRSFRSLVFAAVVVAALAAFLVVSPPESDALPPAGTYTLYYDDYPQYGGTLVGGDGIDCQGNPYSWGYYTTYQVRGRHDC